LSIFELLPAVASEEEIHVFLLEVQLSGWRVEAERQQQVHVIA
jgi:hypothetical protein